MQQEYTVKQRIGKGAMGEVYLARDNRLSRDVAVKRLMFSGQNEVPEDRKQETVNRFLQEARAAAKLNHPNIITIFRVIQAKTENYIVMELLTGKTLEHRLTEGREFSHADVQHVGLQMVSALDYAHQQGVVHRDIKPDNIFLADDLTLKITDFGVARVDTEALMQTRVGTFMGTPTYSSPEQWSQSGTVDGRSDLYSAGVVLYRLLTGRLPFQASALGELVGQILSGSVPAVRSFAPDVPRGLEAVVMKALQRDPDQRFQTGRDFAEALRSALDERRGNAASLVGTQNGAGTSRGDAARVQETILLPPEELNFGSLATQSTLVIRDLEFDDPHWVTTVCASGRRREMPGGGVQEMVDQLLNVPVFAEAFSGALAVDDRFLLLFWRGHIVQAVDLETGAHREEAFARVPEKAKGFTIISFPEALQADMPLVLASVLDEDEVIHRGIDSSMMDVVGFIRKLTHDGFTGVVRLRYPDGQVLLGFNGGARIFLFQSRGLKLDLATTIVTDLTTLVQQRPFKADVISTRFRPLRESVRRFFRGASIDLKAVPGAKHTHASLIKKKRKDLQPQAGTGLRESVSLRPVLGGGAEISVGKTVISPEDLFKGGFGARFSEWLLFEHFLSLLSSGNRDSMKYVSTWIPEIDTIRLNHPLKDEDGRAHVIDVVTVDRDGKILHLAHRGETGDLSEVTSFLSTVTSIKRRLTDSGDIGGAFLVTDRGFTDEAMAHFHEVTAERKKEVGIAYLDSLTGYKGFVRMGGKRGFHFSLVTETDGGFRTVAPVL